MKSLPLRMSTFVVIALILLGLSNNVNAASPDELQQLVKRLQATPDDMALREKIAKLAATMNPKPGIPESAREYFVEAVTVQKQAKAPGDYDLAIQDYKKALLLAPWWSDAYYDLATALELTQQYVDAVEYFKLSVMSDPHGPDARDAQNRIYAVKAEQQLANSQKARVNTQKAVADRMKDLVCTGYMIAPNGVRMTLTMPLSIDLDTNSVDWGPIKNLPAQITDNEVTWQYTSGTAVRATSYATFDRSTAQVHDESQGTPPGPVQGLPYDYTYYCVKR